MNSKGNIDYSIANKKSTDCFVESIRLQAELIDLAIKYNETKVRLDRIRQTMRNCNSTINAITREFMT